MLFKGHNYSTPEWEKAGRVHDWRNYINDGLRAIWGTGMHTPQFRRLTRASRAHPLHRQWASQRGKFYRIAYV